MLQSPVSGYSIDQGCRIIKYILGKLLYIKSLIPITHQILGSKIYTVKVFGIESAKTLHNSKRIVAFGSQICLYTAMLL